MLRKAEQDAAEAEASGDAKAGKRAAHRARGVRKRIDDAQKLAIEIPMASGLAPFCHHARSRDGSPGDAAAHTPHQRGRKPNAQRPENLTAPESHILNSGGGWVQGYN